MSWAAAMTTASFASLGRVRWWILSLAGFLTRGGLLIAIVPIVILPTPAQLEDQFADPSLVGAGLATPTPALVALVVTAIVVLAIAIIATTAVGAWLEASLVETTATDEELAGIAPSTGEDRTITDRAGEGRANLRINLGSAITVRLVAHLPTAVAFIAAAGALATAVTAELASPGDGTSIFARIVARAEWPIAILVLAWLVGETWGGVAIRRLRADRSAWRALGHALLDVVRPSGLATLVLGSVVALVPLLITWYAAGRAFDRLWGLLIDGSDPLLVLVALALLVAIWAASLWLLAIGLTWRSTAWTAEVLRRG